MNEVSVRKTEAATKDFTVIVKHYAARYHLVDLHFLEYQVLQQCTLSMPNCYTAKVQIRSRLTFLLPFLLLF